MTTRERSMAIFLMGLIGILVGGFLAYRMVYKPYTTAKDSLTKLQDEISDLEDKEIVAAKQIKKLHEEQKLSLPVDSDGGVSLARREYEMQLNGLLRKSDFSATAFTVKMGTTDSKNVPFYPEDKKKPIYNRLNFQVTATGSFKSVVTFIWKFYQLPLLHQIRQMTLEKAANSNIGRRTTTDRHDLTMNMQIEALVVDKADPRQTLMAIPTPAALVLGGPATYKLGMMALDSGTPFKYDDVLASDKRDYEQISWKDIFYGKEKVVEVKDVKEPGIDYGPFIRLHGVTSNSDGRLSATLTDLYHKNEYSIDQQPDGSFLSSAFFFVIDRRKPLAEASKYLEYGSEDEENVHRYQILGVDVDARGIYLRSADDKAERTRQSLNLLVGGTSVIEYPGKIYKLSVGGKLSEMDPLLSRTARELIYGGAIQLPPPPPSKQSRSRPGL